ncbi:MAG: hypothetical protein KatS3mg022_1973 [Armatimonadota bacterium]|nr:MAG: hypothetical protein KatS3mg022_1973 [Armatimonadota bacterium]
MADTEPAPVSLWRSHLLRQTNLTPVLQDKADFRQSKLYRLTR